MSYRQAGLASLGSILLPESQEKRLEAMRRDTLERIDGAAKGVSHAVLAGAALSAISTAVLIRSAYNVSRGR